jgi:fringe protein
MFEYQNIQKSLKELFVIFLLQAITSLVRGRKNNKNTRNAKDDENEKVKFLFATGGAGFCISRSLAIKMMPLASNGKFVTIGDKIRFPDDVTLGFIIEYLLKVPLTVVEPFHSHLERMDKIDIETFRDQVN